jgi:GTP-binding protein HflX
MSKLEGQLKELGKTRRTQRKSRDRSGIRTASIVGYTNAGKSTLLNRLTDAGVLVEDRLFATLDPRARRLDLPGGEAVVLSDTVGFIRKLPHQLVEAFKSTLEVVAESDLLIHVVDASSPDPDAQIAAVREVLEEIDAGGVPELLVFNKIDVTTEGKRLVEQHPGSIAISAVTGDGVDHLLEVLGDRLRTMSTVVELVVPYERGDVLAALHRDGEVLVEQHEDTGTRVRARLDAAPRNRYAEFLVESA